ncbi:MAG: family 10 glycosylhydrolase [Clostridia bacterium]|nr:family 10 glycosylhydrolase [Clostridia bacterium]
MKHRLFAFFLIIPLLLSACQAAPQESDEAPEEIRAVWISCFDWESAAGKTEDAYRALTDATFSLLRTSGFNTAFVHLRAFSDAFYPSKLFPASAYIAGKRGGALEFDPFALMLESARTYGIAVHGWINPFRISNEPDPAQLCDGEPAKNILAAGDPNGRIAVLDNGIYYNPAAPENHALILAGVKEILENYDVAGIHIDDYFYPSEDPAIDRAQYAAYTNAGGDLPLREWRMQAVNTFVAALYDTVKAADPALTVSISPAGSLENNRETLCADVETWLSQPGYADWILPQLYFGFEHDTLPFDALLAEWAALPRDESVRLLCGLGAYKLGKADPYAGGGKTEWIDDPALLARQLESVRANDAYSGFAFFSFSDLLREEAQTGVGAFLALL